MRVFILSFLTIVALTSCETPKGSAGSPAQSCPCPKDIMCTEDFRFVTLTVTDKTGAPVRFDRYETVRVSGGAVLARKDNTEMQPGTYVVASDGEKESISTCGEKFLFRGYRDGKKVLEEPFALRNDCCHVERQSGRTEVVL